MRRLASLSRDSRSRSAAISWSRSSVFSNSHPSIRLRSTFYSGLSGPGCMGGLILGMPSPVSIHCTRIAPKYTLSSRIEGL